MRWGWRIAVLAALVLQGAIAWRLTVYDARYHAGRQHYRSGRYREALDLFVQAREVRDSDADLWAWIGDAAYDVYRAAPQGGWDPDRAERLLTTMWGGYAGAVLRSPLDTWSWSGLAEAALQRAVRADAGRTVDLAEIERRGRGALDPWRAVALAAAKRAVELKPSGFQELDELTRVYTSTGQLDAARDALVRSARIMPAPSFHVWGSEQQFVKPLYDAIMSAMQDGLRETPEFERSGLHRDIGRFALEQGDFATALTEMRQALSAAGDTNERYLALRGVAEVLEAMGRLDEAIAAWSDVVDSPLCATADRLQRGVLLHRAKRNKEACRDLRESVREKPEDDALRVSAAAACEESGDVETAERLLREAFVLPVDNPVLARGLIDLYVRVGKRSTAEGVVRTWARDFPKREDFRRWLADLTARQP